MSPKTTGGESFVGEGVYGMPEAAILARTSATTAHYWFKGRDPVIRPHVLEIDGEQAINFLDLIELLVVGKLRKAGHSLQKVRKVGARLRRLMRTEHPFADNRILFDRFGIFLDASIREEDV